MTARLPASAQAIEIERRRQQFEGEIVPEYAAAAYRIADAILQSTATVNRQLAAWCGTLEHEALQQFAQSYTQAMIAFEVEEAVEHMLEHHPLITIVLKVAHLAYETHEQNEEVAEAQEHAEFRTSVAASARDALAHNVVTIATGAMAAIDAPYHGLRDRFSSGGGATVVQEDLDSAGQMGSGERSRAFQQQQESRTVEQVDHIDAQIQRFTRAIQSAERSARQIVPLGRTAIRDAQVAYTRFLAGGRGGPSGEQDAEASAGHEGSEGESRHDPRIVLLGSMGRDGRSGPPVIANIELQHARSPARFEFGDGGDFPREHGDHIDATLSRTWPQLVAAGFQPSLRVSASNPRGSCEFTIVNVTSNNVEIQEPSAAIYHVLAGFLDMPGYTDEQAALVVLRMQAGRLSTTPFSEYDY